MKATQRDTEFTEFVTAQRTALLRTARLLTAGDEAYAEDLVQTTLTRLYVHWPRVRRAGNPVGYARTSLTHAFVDERRRAYTEVGDWTDRLEAEACTLGPSPGQKECSANSEPFAQQYLCPQQNYDDDCRQPDLPPIAAMGLTMSGNFILVFPQRFQNHERDHILCRIAARPI